MSNLKKCVFWTIIIVVANLCVDIAFTPWIKSACEHYPNQEILEENKNSDISWVDATVLGPIIEEFLFRGPILLLLLFLQDNRDSKYFKILLICVILISGAIFGLVHIPNGGLYILVPTIIAISIHGILWGLLAVITRNLIYPISAHSIKNIIALIT